jgi:hypothetical protein
MGITTLPTMGGESVVDELVSLGTARPWLMPTPGRVDHGLFERALRAAAIVWQPDWFGAHPRSSEAGPMMALPEVLEAWRATERELVVQIGLGVDGPGRQLLEANVSMLRAMYQRLYVEHTSR